MKKYIEICGITLLIQVVAYLISVLLYEITGGSSSQVDIAIVPILLGVVTAIVVDIILAIRWGDSIVEKLIYIFLMPTNYLWVAFVLWAICYVGQWFDMFSNIYR